MTDIIEKATTRADESKLSPVAKEFYIQGVKDGASWANEWIAVKDRFPEESGYYDTYLRGFSRRLELYFSTETKRFSDFKRETIAVTHWKPIPEPPKH